MLEDLDVSLFCSRRDPRKEARVWMDLQLPLLQFADEVILLGLGAGWHLQEWLQSGAPRPATLVVVEKREELVERWIANHPQLANQVQFVPAGENLTQNLPQFATILEFRPAWTGHEQFYTQLFNALIGSPLTEIVSRLDVSDQSPEAKTWRALRELVQ